MEYRALGLKSSTKPTTAEKLLWVVEKRREPIIFNSVNCFSIGDDKFYFWGEPRDKYRTLSEAIDAAYNCVKAQENE